MGKTPERGNVPLPSEAEFRLLREFWRSGELSVRQLHERLASEQDVGYTTTLKLVQRLHAKGLLSRREEGRAHVYRAVQSEDRIERRLVGDFLDRMFDGALDRLVQRALPERAAEAETLDEIRRLIREADER
jgi:predicted transcriptional regulator